jgi:hypothetical protein
MGPVTGLIHAAGVSPSQASPETILSVLQQLMALRYVDVDEASTDAAINAVFGRRGSHGAADLGEDQRGLAKSP